MRRLASLIAACLASLVLYALVFGFLVHKPLTIDVIADLLRRKVDYAERIGSPKLVVFAGSNARFSHRCETIEQVLALPCVNFGVARGIGLDYLLGDLEPVLRPGDVVYMPLEYEWYLDDKIVAMTGPDGALMAYGDKRRLFALGWERSLRAVFAFDPGFLVSGLVEMALDVAAFQRRVGAATLDRQGDEIGHTQAEAVPYRAYIDSARPSIPSAASLAAPSYAKAQIAAFLDGARARGILVIGGLQTVFDDAPVTAETIATIRHIYEASGQRFLLLDSHSQYPRACFFDTPAHLIEPCQVAHSTLLAQALALALGRDGR
jgi:hypothetical protein